MCILSYLKNYSRVETSGLKLQNYKKHELLKLIRSVKVMVGCKNCDFVFIFYYHCFLDLLESYGEVKVYFFKYIWNKSHF